MFVWTPDDVAQLIIIIGLVVILVVEYTKR